ncbi:MAG: hypothetical protein SCK29_06360 [Bacillota bacterium]|nr:hypothetical protein [Bacillota bacterium]MDW7683731.1 hypothetical protein [Bacillota bacterium]
MAKCEQCEMEVKETEIYQVNGVKMCEECSMKYSNPSRPCGGGPGGSSPN